jgi:hypothetical protein
VVEVFPSSRQAGDTGTSTFTYSQAGGDRVSVESEFGSEAIGLASTRGGSADGRNTTPRCPSLRVDRQSEHQGLAESRLLRLGV